MDQDLVARAQGGDRKAFETLTASDYARLFRVAHGILRDRSRAEDATQQAYFDIWRNIRRLREPARFEAWSFRVLVRACYAEARRTPRWVPESLVPPVRMPRAADAYGAVDDRDELEGAFAALNIDQRVVIVLHFLLDMTLDQVAATLDIPRGTVDSRLGRGLRAMRTAMGVEARPLPTRTRGEVAR